MKPLNEINEALQQAIPPDAVHPANQAAQIYGDYVTAQWAMQEANAIFGLDGVEDFEVLSDERIELQLPGKTYGHWVFITTVKVWFRAEDNMTRFCRVGRGVGVAQCPQGTNPVKPQQIDTAAKAALSDSIKNALMRTGRRLGAQLYFDERSAQALGYDIASEQAEREPGGSNELEILGEKVCERGIGKPDDETGEKPFTGWTISEMWSDADGHKLITGWAVGLDNPKGFVKDLVRYAELMSEAADDAADRVRRTEAEMRSGNTIVIWTGETKVANQKPDWGKLITNEAFADLLEKAFNPDGRIKNFGPMNKRMTNHYQAHFGVKPPNLTWAMLDALVTRCKEGEEAAAFKYPDWYGREGPAGPPTHDEIVKHISDDQYPYGEDQDDSDSEREDLPPLDGVHDTPHITLGPQQNQSIPSGIQKAAKEALKMAMTDGIVNVDRWLWESMLGEKSVDEWTLDHTNLAMKIIGAVKEGTIDEDNLDTLPGTMWEFGLDTIG